MRALPILCKRARTRIHVHVHTHTHTQYTQYTRSCMLHTLRVEVIIGHLNPCITEFCPYIRCAHGRLYVAAPVPFEFARVLRVCFVGLAVEHRDG